MSIIRFIITLLLSIQAAILCAHFGHGDASPAAVVLLEGFDHMSTSQFTSKGWGTVLAATPAGRFGGQGGQLNTNQNTTKVLPSTYTTLVAGFGWQANLSINNSDRDIFYFQTAAHGLVAKVRYSASHLAVYNAAGTLVATGTTTISSATWYGISFKVTASATGAYELRINGVSELSGTANFGTTNIAEVKIGGTTGVQASATTTFDDLYVLDTTGTYNDFIGDPRIATSMPDGDGNHSQWSPTGGGAHYTQVNETVADGDTTYVSDSTVNDIDTYTVADIDGGATVYGVQVNIYARKDDAATRQIAPVIRQSSTDYVGTTATLGSTYAFVSQLYAQDPTSADWTASTVNADEFGVKEIA